MTKAERRERLLPAGEPRHVRCYDDGKSGDRYTVVFTGRYRHKTRGAHLYVGMSALPFHPQGIGQHGESVWPLDRSGYGHLGRKIKFSALPDDCKRLVLRDYADLWDLVRS